MPARKTGDSRLGRVELAILDEVWNRRRATVREVQEALVRDSTPAYSTVLTMMRKLEQKGYLTHEVEDRAHVYRATLSRQAVRQGLLGDLLERVFSNSPSLLFSSLVERDRISKKEMGKIRALLAEEDGDE